MAFEIRMAGPADGDDLVRLFHEADLHYWGDGSPSLDATDRHVRTTVLGEGHGCEIVVALEAGRAVAFATFAILFKAPNLSGQLFLKDLFTSAEVRGKGIGEKMMRYVAKVAVERGCSRFDWTTEEDNPRALAFYDRLGAKRVTDKVYFRLDKERLAAFAADGDD